VGFGRNINFLQFTDNTYFIVDFIYISFSTLNSQFSIVDKTCFVNPRITAFFAASGQFGGKKTTFLMSNFDKMTFLTKRYLHLISGEMQMRGGRFLAQITLFSLFFFTA
jgi:hypothetical protein